MTVVIQTVFASERPAAGMIERAAITIAGRSSAIAAGGSASGRRRSPNQRIGRDGLNRRAIRSPATAPTANAPEISAHEEAPPSSVADTTGPRTRNGDSVSMFPSPE